MILILETQKFVAPYSFQIFDLLNPLAGTTGYHFSTEPCPRLFFRFAYRLVLICTVVFSAVLIQYPGSIKVWIISISRAEKVQQGSGIIRIDLLVILTKAIAAIYVLSLAEFTEEH